MVIISVSAQSFIDVTTQSKTLFHSPDHTYKKRRAKEIIEEEYLARIAVEASSKK